MKIFLTGGSGFIGSLLARGLTAKGHSVTVLRRGGYEAVRGRETLLDYVTGDPMEPGTWQDCMVDHDVVMNLAGESIFRRWSGKIKRDIVNSRVAATRNVVDALKRRQPSPVALFNASGVGYYGYTGDFTVDESSPPGDTFLAKVAAAWETEAKKAEDLGVRVVFCRFGIVLGRGGGALGRIANLVRYFLGGSWGDGNQWFSWIHEKDVVNICLFLLDHSDMSGAVNFTAPEPVTNRDMIHMFREVIQRDTLIKNIPESVWELVLGEFSRVFLRGQRVMPRALMDSGFRFEHPVLKGALADLLGV